MRLSSTGYALAGIATLSLITLGPELTSSLSALGSADFDGAFLAGASLLLIALSLWTLMCVALGLLADGAGAAGRLAPLVTPRFVRHALFVGAASALVIAPVSATTESEHALLPHGQSLLSQSLDGLRLPDRPVAERFAEAERPTPDPGVISAPEVAVKRGDTLWSLAARELGPNATATEIDSATGAWHRANRELIGPDPNLIFPGQHLTVPTKDTP